MIRALIVEDEPIARGNLRRALAAHADIELVGEVGDGPAAVEAVVALHPDLVFLDVQIPGCDGFEALERMRERLPGLPMVVFSTAFDRHALRAFDVHAVDYLLKPCPEERLAEALDRVRDCVRRQDGEETRHLGEMLDEVRRREPGGWLRRFVVREHGTFRFVNSADVVWIRSAGNYAEIHAHGQTHLVRVTMAGLEDALDPTAFARVHRTVIVRLERVREARIEPSGDGTVTLDTGHALPLSRRYRDRLLG